ncbi:MAG: hypothetical protein WCF84_19235 [Anaerolineae bacterium]
MQKLVTWGWPVLVAVVAAVVAIFVASSQTTSMFNTTPPNLTTDPNAPKLWVIQPGLGTVMIEYGTRMGNVYWAADAGNWDMVNYQIKEMLEIQETGEVTRPGRADALKKFEDANITPMVDAAKTKDKTAFMAAYDKAITGCNKCHGEQKDSATGLTFRFVKIMRPADKSPFSNVDWAGATGQ